MIKDLKKVLEPLDTVNPYTWERNLWLLPISTYIHAARIAEQQTGLRMNRMKEAKSIIRLLNRQINYN